MDSKFYCKCCHKKTNQGHVSEFKIERKHACFKEKLPYEERVRDLTADEAMKVLCRHNLMLPGDCMDSLIIDPDLPSVAPEYSTSMYVEPKCVPLMW